MDLIFGADGDGDHRAHRINGLRLKPGVSEPLPDLTCVKRPIRRREDSEHGVTPRRLTLDTSDTRGTTAVRRRHRDWRLGLKLASIQLLRSLDAPINGVKFVVQIAKLLLKPPSVAAQRHKAAFERDAKFVVHVYRDVATTDIPCQGCWVTHCDVLRNLRLCCCCRS